MIILMLWVGVAYAQERRAEFEVDFRVNSATIDSSYHQNQEIIRQMRDFLQNIAQDSLYEVLEVSFQGATSPEGSEQINRRLARKRLASFEEYVRHRITIPDSLVAYIDGYIDWDHLRDAVDTSTLASHEGLQAILNTEKEYVQYDRFINRRIDKRVLLLMELDSGKVWQQLHTEIFPYMRNAKAVITIYRHREDIPMTALTPTAISLLSTQPDTVQLNKVTPLYRDWVPQMYIKTNLLMWAIGVSNGAVEFDLAKHWSFAVPVYYSAWNYFIPTLKFRTLATQPELRYWFSQHNRGLYLGAHFGVASYNVAVDGGYRYQDHDGIRPALGGGIGVGYRLPIKHSQRWNVEFMLGAGAYWLHYDLFYNVDNGKLANIKKMTYWGVDNAAVNISYSIDLKKRNR